MTVTAWGQWTYVLARNALYILDRGGMSTTSAPQLITTTSRGAAPMTIRATAQHRAPCLDRRLNCHLLRAKYIIVARAAVVCKRRQVRSERPFGDDVGYLVKREGGGDENYTPLSYFACMKCGVGYNPHPNAEKQSLHLYSCFFHPKFILNSSEIHPTIIRKSS